MGGPWERIPRECLSGLGRELSWALLGPCLNLVSPWLPVRHESGLMVVGSPPAQPDGLSPSLATAPTRWEATVAQTMAGSIAGSISPRVGGGRSRIGWTEMPPTHPLGGLEA